MKELSASEAKALAAELTALSKQQAEVLHLAAYLTMSKQDAAAYDKRAERIRKICDMLHDYGRA